MSPIFFGNTETSIPATIMDEDFGADKAECHKFPMLSPKISKESRGEASTSPPTKSTSF
jgi:hypothetical protein